jgi:hypothetical protein
MKKSYSGSCHCRAVTFEVDVDLREAGTGKCNCRICWKMRMWSAKVRPEDLRVTSGADALTRYWPRTIGGGFCKRCGVTPFTIAETAEWNAGRTVSINLATLDGVEPDELLSAPMQYFDGLHDNWWNAPKETRHL